MNILGNKILTWTPNVLDEDLSVIFIFTIQRFMNFNDFSKDQLLDPGSGPVGKDRVPFLLYEDAGFSHQGTFVYQLLGRE